MLLACCIFGAAGAVAADVTPTVKILSAASVTNDLGNLTFSTTKPLYVQGALSNQVKDVFTFKAGTTGTFRIALDPDTNTSSRVKATITLSAVVDPLVPSSQPAATNVTDVSAGEVTFSFTANTTYLVTVTPPDDRPPDFLYRYVFSIARAGRNVTCDVAGGTVTGMPYYGTNFNYSVGTPFGYLPDAKKEGVSLTGWYTADGKKVSADTLVPNGTEALTLSARYDAGTYPYTVVYTNTSAHVTGTMTNEIFYSDTTNTLAACTYAWTNHIFQGWATTSTSTDVKYKDKARVDTPLTTVSNGTVTLYGVWKNNNVHTQVVDGIAWKYTVDEKGEGATVVDGASASSPAISPYVSGAIEVPTRLGGEYVVALGEKAFYGCAKITSVTIPGTVSNIAACAFQNCRQLKKVIFEHDHALQEIPSKCFAGCTALEKIELPNAASQVAYLQLPYSITAIGDEAFANCVKLIDAKNGLTIPEHVSEMGASVFTNCTGLKIIRYLGAQPDAADDVYAGTPSNTFTSAVMCQMWNTADPQNQALGTTWKKRKIATWSTAPDIRRIRFDANGGSGACSNFYIKGHAFVALPEDPTWADAAGTNVVHAFQGWYTAKTGGVRITPDTVVTDPATYYAQWKTTITSSVERCEIDLYDETLEENPLALDKAHTFDAFVFIPVKDDSDVDVDDENSDIGDDVGDGDGDDEIIEGDDGETAPYAGYVSPMTVTVAKGTWVNAVRESAVSVTVARDGLGQIFKGTMQNGLPVTVTATDGSGETMALTFTSNGVAGVWGGTLTNEIQGARRGMAVTGDWMVADYDQRYLNKAWEVAFVSEDDETITNLAFTLTAGAKGVMTLKGEIVPWDKTNTVVGTIASVAFSATAQIVMGESESYVPVQITLPNEAGTLLMLLALDDAASETGVSAVCATYVASTGQEIDLGEFTCTAKEQEEITYGDALEDYAKTLDKNGGLTVKATKAGQWFLDDGAEDDGAEHVVTTPVAAGANAGLTFTLKGPGLFTLTPEILGSAGTCTCTATKPKLTGTYADGNEGAFTVVVPSGSSTVKMTCKVPRNVDSMPFKAVWKWVSLASAKVLSPVDKSAVADNENLTFSWSVPEKDNEVLYRVTLDPTKSKVGDKATYKNEAADADGTTLEGFTPECGKAYYWRVDFGHEDYTNKDGSTVWTPLTSVSTFTVADHTLEPVITKADGPELSDGAEVPLMQGVKAAFQLSSKAEGTVTYKVAGGKLPAGLTLNAKTGLLSGVPTKAGAYQTVFQALKGKTAGVTVTLNFTVAALGLGAGTFTGLLYGEGDPTNTAYVANVSFTATTAGKLSAKVTSLGKATSYTATGFDAVEVPSEGEDGEEVPRMLSATLLNIVKSGRKATTNTLAVTAYAASVTNRAAACLAGTATNDVAGVMRTGTLRRDNAKVTGWTDLVTPFKGYYTVALTKDPETDPEAPEGNGYLTATVDQKGKVKVAGVLADGTSVSASQTGFVCDVDEDSSPVLVVPVYIGKAKSTFAGELVFKEEAGVVVVDSAAPFFWANDDVTSTQAGDTGFTCDLSPVGGYYDKVENLQVHYENTALHIAAEKPVSSNPVLYALADGMAFAFRNNAPSVANTSYATFTFTRATGVSSGTVTLYTQQGDGTYKKSATCKHKGIWLLNRAKDNALLTNVVSAGFYLQPVKITEGRKRTWNASRAFNVVAGDSAE